VEGVNMNAKVIKDKNLPPDWQRIKTPKHKYIVIQNSNVEIFHCDDCTFNNLYFVDKVRDINDALSFINNYEIQNPS